MARKKADLNQKVVELRRILDQYGGIPSIQQDKAAYLNLYYYLNRYGDEPQIQELISDYNLEEKANNNHKRCTDINQKIEELKKILNQYGGIPSQQQDKAAYSNIYYNFKKYAHLPQIQDLIAKYNVAPRRKKDLDQKVDELKQILDKYGCIPTQQQDRAAYANINYYLKRYGDEPQIQELMSTYNIKAGRRVDIDTQINEIATILQEYGRIPAVKDNETLYYRIRGFFQNHKDHPEVIKLKYLYAHGSCFPLPNTKYGPRPDAEYQYDSWDGRAYVSDEWIQWKNNVTYEFIEYVYKKYQKLPSSKTKPMIFLRKKIDHWYRYNIDTPKAEQSEIFDFLQRMIDIGCNESFIKEAYYSFKFISADVQEQVEKMIIENGACAIHYIAQTSIPECTLSDSFVYNYYYVKLNDQNKCREKMPLGSLYSYSGVAPHRVLRVHYRDYHKCDVNKIRESAKEHYRNWRDFRPETIEEWKYYGQSEFFDNKEDYFNTHILGEYDSSIDWNTTYIEKQLIKGEPYFRYYKGNLRYLDYYLYLLENGYTLTDKELLDLFEIEKLAYNEDLLDEDLITISRLSNYLPNCMCDENGGCYLKQFDGYILLCIAPKTISYKLNNQTRKIAPNAFKLSENSLKTITINDKLYENKASFGNDSRLEKILIPTHCVDKYLNLFSKFEVTKFHNFNGNKIDVKEKIESDKLLYVPYTKEYRVPENIKSIEKNAFKGSGIKKLIITGGIKIICEDLLKNETELEEVILLEGIERISEGTFSSCKNLKNIILPNSLHTIESSFAGCSSLETIKLGHNISWIGDNAFCGCSSIENIIIEGQLKYLGKNAFSCKNLKHIEFKKGIDKIECAFSYCLSLETITFRGKYNSFGHYIQSLGLYYSSNLKSIYVQAEYMELFKKNLSSKLHNLLKAIY